MVVKKNSYIEIRSGTHSYSDLKRYVQVMEHILQKSESRYKCVMEYDSQNDTITEMCKKYWIIRNLRLLYLKLTFKKKS